MSCVGPIRAKGGRRAALASPSAVNRSPSRSLASEQPEVVANFDEQLENRLRETAENASAAQMNGGETLGKRSRRQIGDRFGSKRPKTRSDPCTSAEETYHNWVMANDRTAAALKAKGYDYRFVFSRATTTL